MSVTLEAIKIEQAKVAEMIANFEAQAQSRTLNFSAHAISLAPGEEYAGVIVGKDGECCYHLILLPDDKDDLNWEAAKAWAASVGGELPNRREQALLYANLKDQFQSAWYWSSEQHASYSDFAWSQDFYYGGQGSYDKSSELRARAVRRLIL